MPDPTQVFFEDIPLDQPFLTPGRTITEADIVGFAGISGDWNALHVDAQYAAASPFGARIAHGLLVLSIASGMTTRLPIMAGLQPALLGLAGMSCTWPAPTPIGDTIRIELTFTAAVLTPSGTRGRVTERRRALNQDEVVVLESEWLMLVATRAGAQR
jgi:acyl dehydratase